MAEQAISPSFFEAPKAQSAASRLKIPLLSLPGDGLGTRNEQWADCSEAILVELPGKRGKDDQVPMIGQSLRHSDGAWAAMRGGISVDCAAWQAANG